jgi:CHAT domain-containing protein
VLFAASAAILFALAAPGDTVRATVLRAESAVEHDSAADAATLWRARLAHDSTDRAARLGLEVLASLLGDTTQAVRWANSLAPPNGAITDRFAARAALDRANVRSVGTNVAAVVDALTAVAHAARALGDSATAAEALITLSIWRAHQRGPRYAMAVLDSAAAIIPRGDVRLLALWRCKRAEILAAGGSAGAAAEAQKGATMAHAAGNARQEGVCLSVLAEGDIGRGDVTDAIPLLRRAGDLERRARGRTTLAATLQWLGYAELQADQLAAARRDFAAAIAVGDSVGYGSAVAWSWYGLANLSLEVGDLSTASASLGNADSLFKAQGDGIGMARGRGLRALVDRLAGHDEEARAVYDTVLVDAARSGDFALEGDTRVALAQLALANGDVPEAHSELAAYRTLARRKGSVEAAAGRSYEFAVLALAEGNLERAEILFRGILAQLGGRDFRDRYAAGAGLAQAYLRSGDTARAALAIDTAARALDAWRSTLDERALRVQAYQEQSLFGPEERGVPGVIAGLAAAGEIEVAFRVAERRRARELFDALVRARAAATDSVSSAHASMRALSLAELRTTQAAIPDDSTALLEYVAGGHDQATTVFVITRKGARASVLGHLQTLDADVTLFTALLEGSASARIAGRRLEGEVLDPAIATLPPSIRRLVIVPDGALHWLPFDALTLPDGRFVVERFAVSEVPSASVAVQLWTSPHRPPTSTLLAFGDPQFAVLHRASTLTGDVYGDAFASNGGLPRLVASADEARHAARYAARSVVLLRADASESRLKREPLAQYGVIHFATHALIDESSTTRTALALAPGGGESGFIGPDELAALHFDADLVVLSGCQTAGGKELRGEGLQGLTAPLLAAGVRSVVATRWRIVDREAAVLMDDFYLEMARGRPVADAVQRMKLHALTRGAPPGEWAAYTVLGDPVSRPALTRPSIVSRLEDSIAELWRN